MQDALKQRVEADLTAYLDGELPAARADEVREALEADPQLAAEAQALQETWDLLETDAARSAVKIDVTHRVMRAVRREAERRRRRVVVLRRTLASVLSVAAAVLLAVFVGLLMPKGPSPENQEFIELPADVKEVLIANLDVVLDRVTLEHLDTVRALDREGVFAAAEERGTPR